MPRPTRFRRFVLPAGGRMDSRPMFLYAPYFFGLAVLAFGFASVFAFGVSEVLAFDSVLVFVVALGFSAWVLAAAFVSALSAFFAAVLGFATALPFGCAFLAA